MMSAAQLHELPWYVDVTLWVSILIAFIFTFFATPHKGWVLGFLGTWAAFVCGLTFAPISLPYWSYLAGALSLLGLSFFIPAVKSFLFSLEVELLHYLHLWRLPFAFVLLWLYQAGYSGITNTFEGLNYDIVIGLTAPVIASLAFSQKMLNREILIGWNVLGMLAWGIAIWLTSSELTRSIHFSALFERLPYTFLMGFLMPISLFSHLLTLAHLFKGDIEVES